MEGARPFETVNGCRRCQGPRRSKIVYALEAVTLASTTKEKGTSRTGQVEGRSERAQLLVALLPDGRPFEPWQCGTVRVKVNAQGSPLFSSFFFSLNEVNEDSFHSCLVV